MNEVPLVGALYDLPGFEAEGLRYAVLSRRRSTDDGASLPAIVIFDRDMSQVGVLRWEALDVSAYPPHQAIEQDPAPVLGEIRHVEVREDWRGRGLTTALLEVAREAATKMNWFPPRPPASSTASEGTPDHDRASRR